MLRLVDLFAGTGAFSYAFQQTGAVVPVFANDHKPSSKHIYEKNIGHALTCKDIHDVTLEEIPPHDILTGGFPCQPFSIAGKREGFEDQRSNVFWKMLAIVDHHHPSCLVLENVKNLVTHDEGRTMAIILHELTRRGYHVIYKVLNTSTVTGIPHHRERMYLVALRSASAFASFSLDLPRIESNPVSSYWEANVPAKYYYTDRSSIWPNIKDAVTDPTTVYQYRRVYVRENKKKECPTLTANMGTGGHNVPLVRDAVGIRKLTPRECFSLQGFPPTYHLEGLSDTALYQLAGNAVSVPILDLIAQRLIYAFTQ